MTSINEVENLLDFTFSLAKEDLCGKSLTVSILQDIFDLSSKRKCEEFFAVVEKSIVEWKTVRFCLLKCVKNIFFSLYFSTHAKIPFSECVTTCLNAYHKL